MQEILCDRPQEGQSDRVAVRNSGDGTGFLHTSSNVADSSRVAQFERVYAICGRCTMILR